MEWWGGLQHHPRLGTKSVAPWVLHLLHLPGSSSDSGPCWSSQPPGVGTRSMTPRRTAVWERPWCPLSVSRVWTELHLLALLPVVLPRIPENYFEAESARSDVSLPSCSLSGRDAPGGALLCSRLEEGVWGGGGDGPQQGTLCWPLSSVSPPLVLDSHHLLVSVPSSTLGSQRPCLGFLVEERPARGTRADDSRSSLERSWAPAWAWDAGAGAGCRVL